MRHFLYIFGRFLSGNLLVKLFSLHYNIFRNVYREIDIHILEQADGLA